MRLYQSPIIFITACLLLLSACSAKKPIANLEVDAITSQEKGDLISAKESWTQLLLQDPTNWKANYNLAYVADNLNEKDLAIESYKKALQVKPLDADTHNNLALLYLSKGDLDQALNHINQASTIQPQNQLIKYNLALIKHHRKEYESALKGYKEVINKNPEMYLAVYNTGKIIERQGKCVEALEWYQQSISINPQFWEALYSAARLYHKRGRYADALKYYDLTLSANPGLNDATVNRSNVVQAMQIEKNLDAQLEESGYSVLEIAGAYHQSGFLAKAEEYYRRAMEESPKDPRAIGNLAHVSLMQTCFVDSKELYQKAIKLDPKNTALKQGLAAVDKSLKDSLEQAVK